MNNYPYIRFIVKHGTFVALLLGSMPAICAAIVMIALDLTAWVLVLGVMTSLIGWFIAMSFVELVQVIADMLLPK